MTEYDGYKGVKTSDPNIQGNVQELLRWLQTYNSRPRLSARIHGWHRERRTRRVSYQDSNGNTQYRTEE